MSEASPNTTPPRDIPSSLNPEQATESESGLLLNSVRQNESVFAATSLSLHSSIPASLMSKLSTSVVFPDNMDHPNEDAMQYPKDCAPSSSSESQQDSHRESELAMANGDVPVQQLSTADPDENLVTPQQVEQRDSDTETTEIVIIDDYCSKSLIDGYLIMNMKTERDQEPQAAGNLSDLQGASPGVETTQSTCEEEEPLFQMDGDDLHNEHEDRSEMPLPFFEAKKEFGYETEKEKRDTNDLDDEHLTIERVPQDSSKNRSASESSDTSSGSDKSSRDSRKEIDIIMKRDKVCSSISGCSSQTEYKSSRFTITGVKGTCTFHAQGLDQDLENHYGTVTAIFDFPKDLKSSHILNQPDCKIKLSVYVYEGPVEKNQLIGESSSCRTPTDEDIRQNRKLHMTVHRVVNLCDIIFSKVCPSKITVKIVVEIL